MKTIKTLPPQVHMTNNPDFKLHSIRFGGGPLGSWIKPEQTFWTSTYTPNKKYKSSWEVFLAEEDDNLTPRAKSISSWKKEYYYAYLIDVAPKSRILDIETTDDLLDFEEKYVVYKDIKNPKTEKWSKLYNGRVRWHQVAENYDAVHYSGRTAKIGTFNGWDVESTVWFRNRFLSMRRL